MDFSTKKKNLMKANFVNASETLNWIIDDKKITHKKGFFSIIPFLFEDSEKNKWYQPLIVQKEIGILGIIKKIQKC